mgnify:CR=1 FL=1
MWNAGPGERKKLQNELDAVTQKRAEVEKELTELETIL